MFEVAYNMFSILPDDIYLVLLKDWLSTSDLACFDSALTSKIVRPRFLQLLKQNYFSTQGILASAFTSRRSFGLYLEWVLKRQVNLRRFDMSLLILPIVKDPLSIESSEIDEEELVVEEDDEEKKRKIKENLKPCSSLSLGHLLQLKHHVKDAEKIPITTSSSRAFISLDEKHRMLLRESDSRGVRRPHTNRVF